MNGTDVAQLRWQRSSVEKSASSLTPDSSLLKWMRTKSTGNTKALISLWNWWIKEPTSMLDRLKLDLIKYNNECFYFLLRSFLESDWTLAQRRLVNLSVRILPASINTVKVSYLIQIDIYFWKCEFDGFLMDFDCFADTPEERDVMLKALRQCENIFSRFYLNENFEDIKFDFQLRDDIVIGSPFK